VTQHDHQFARQPIVDRHGEVVAFELLFRAAPNAETADVVDGPAATRSVLAAHSRSPSVTTKAFVNLPRESLLDRTLFDLPPDRFGAEVLEDIADHQDVIAALDELRAAGYTVALDDFRPDPRRIELLDHTDLVKLDVQELSRVELADVARLAKKRGVTLVAEKVETIEEFEAFLELGFDLFQGYLFGVPEMVTLSPVDIEFGRRWQGLRHATTSRRHLGGWMGQPAVAGPLKP
jgi:c-di-GMP phosphodiesterase